MKAPRAQRGQRLTHSLWNRMARAVDDALASPRDLDEGITPEEAENPAASTVEREVSRASNTVRITQQDNEDNFVDVSRPRYIIFRLSDGTLVQRVYSSG